MQLKHNNRARACLHQEKCKHNNRTRACLHRNANRKKELLNFSPTLHTYVMFHLSYLQSPMFLLTQTRHFWDLYSTVGCISLAFGQSVTNVPYIQDISTQRTIQWEYCHTGYIWYHDLQWNRSKPLALGQSVAMSCTYMFVSFLFDLSDYFIVKVLSSHSWIFFFTNNDLTLQITCKSIQHKILYDRYM